MDDGSDFPALLESTLLGLLDSMDEGALVFDLAGTCRMVGRRVGELFGHEPSTLVGRPRVEVLKTLAVATDDVEGFMTAVSVNDLDLPAQQHGEHDLERPRHRVIVWTSYPLVLDGKRQGRLCLVRDVTRERSAERARAALQRRLDAALPIDPITGLVNRRRFVEELDREHHRATRSWDSYAVLVVDVDGLADVNESHGQPVGDQALEEFAGALKRARREYDVVARLDGDDFGLLLPGADPVAAEAVSERIALALRELKVADGLALSGCVGAAVWQPGSRDKATDVLDRAQRSLEAAQRKGRAHLAVEGEVRGLPEATPSMYPSSLLPRPPKR
jgi:diguanylate cyclase (GGDEF)-like protein